MKKQFVLGALVATTVLQSSMPAFANNEVVGDIVGGIIGGVIGSQLGKGDGKTAATIIGTIAGTMIGGVVGRDLDEADRRAFGDAQSRALRDQLGRRSDWHGRSYGSHTGAYGSFTSVREGYNFRTGEYCREYTSVIYVNNRTEETRGIACSRRDGSWYEVRYTEVNFGGNGGPVSYPDHRPPRYPENPLPPPPPAQSQYEGSAQISSISRHTGGEWYRLTLLTPIELQRLEIETFRAGLKIHEASLITDTYNRIEVREFKNTPVFYSGSRAVSENLSFTGRIIAIDLRLESFGASADVLVKALSLSSRPQLVYRDFQPVPVPTPAPAPVPPPNWSSLSGYCNDEDHRQFFVAKQFAYAGNGLNYTDNEATRWALSYNQAHRCDTIQEYRSRYEVLYQVAYAGNGLNYTSNGAKDFALRYVEIKTVPEARSMADRIKAAYRFAYAANGLNKSASDASQFGLNWVENNCENESHISFLWENLKKEYQFAYSTNGLNMSSSAATQYAAEKVSRLTRCGHLLR